MDAQRSGRGLHRHRNGDGGQPVSREGLCGDANANANGYGCSHGDSNGNYCGYGNANSDDCSHGDANSYDWSNSDPHRFGYAWGTNGNTNGYGDTMCVDDDIRRHGSGPDSRWTIA
jgi:hypothetical protein